MKKRILAALISGIMVVTGISACSGGANSSVDSSSATTTASTTATTTAAETTTTTTTAATTTETTTAATTTEATTPAPETTEATTPAPETTVATTTEAETEAPAPEVTTGGASVEFSQNLMPGWNLGNQLEANSGGTPSETAWGNPTITEKLIKEVKAQGFKSVRIPVSYLSKIGDGPDYAIDSAWLDRVQEVVDMCINNGLYAIINIHGDGYYSVGGSWLLCNEPEADQKVIKEKFKKVWAQIADRFKNYDEHLVYESMNEVFDGNYSGPTAENYGNINDYNQIFVDTVRNAGGNNGSRYLLIPGWNTNINFTTGDCDSYTMQAKFVIPNDSRIMISVHYYDPWDFCGEEGSDTFYKWGDTAKKFVKPRQSESLVNRQFDKLYNAFIANGYGVVIGEYGSIDRTSKNEINTIYRAYFAEYVNYAAHQRNIVTVYWDNGYNGNHGFGLFDRTKCTVTQPEIIKGIMDGAKATAAPAAPTE